MLRKFSIAGILTFNTVYNQLTVGCRPNTWFTGLAEFARDMQLGEV
jgi:hypothetical protein